MIWETANFEVLADLHPLVDRDDGGHVVIQPRRRIRSRQDLSPEQAIEFIRLTLIVGEAMTLGLSKQGVPIGRINYQDSGNWSVFKPEGPFFHYHLFGRSLEARHQKYGEALHFPHRDRHPEVYEHLKPLNEQDQEAIRSEIKRLMKKEIYCDKNWGL